MSKLNILTEWIKENPIDIMDMVHNVYIECFGEKVGLSEFSEYKQDVDNHIKRVKTLDLEGGKVPSNDEIKIETVMYVILKAWHQATFTRQQCALYDEEMENESLFILEHELCHRYPFLREAFDILDGIYETAIPKETIESEEDDELPF